MIGLDSSPSSLELMRKTRDIDSLMYAPNSLRPEVGKKEVNQMKRYLNAFFALLLCLLLCGVIFISDTTASATGETGTISGRVVDAISSDPVSGAVIYVFEYSSLSGPGWNLLGWTATDTGGYYATPSLPEGQYGVRFHAAGYAIGWYEDAHTADDATPVLVTAPNETPNINGSLGPGGGI